jgi:hypothetical protein
MNILTSSSGLNGHFNPNDGGSKLLRNLGAQPNYYTAQQPPKIIGIDMAVKTSNPTLGKWPLGRSKRGLEDDVKMDFVEISCEGERRSVSTAGRWH